MLEIENSNIDLDILFAPIINKAKVGIAVSGGADSLALMLLVNQWSKAQNNSPTIFVYSIDHGLRESSKSEVAFVLSEASKLGLIARGLSWEGNKPNSGLQKKAREARYKIIAKAMQRDGVDILLTAHHAGDQAETILMRLSHASGISGLIGMAKFSTVQGVKIFRPLLEISALNLRNIVEKAKINPIIDPSNENEKYERIRWRKILPILADLGLDEQRLAIFSKRMARADKALKYYCDEIFQKIVTIDSLGILRIELLYFYKQVEEIQIRILQKSLRYIGGDEKPFALSQIEALLFKLTADLRFAKTTLHGCSIKKIDNKYIEIVRELTKITTKQHMLKPNEEICWDNRFLIKNISPDIIKISSSSNLTKKQLKFFQDLKQSNMQQIRSAPLIKNINGDIIGVGCFIRDKKAVAIGHNIDVKNTRKHKDLLIT